MSCRMAVLLGLAGCLIVAHSNSAYGQRRTDAVTAVTSISVDLSGSGEAESDTGWTAISGGSLNIEVADSSSGTDRTRSTTSGQNFVEELTLTGPVTAGRQGFLQWITETVEGRDFKRAVTLSEIGTDGSVAHSFQYLDCFPVRYVFPKLDRSSTELATETIVIKPIRMQSGAGSSQSVAKNELLMAGQFSVEIENYPAASAGVQSVEVDDLVIDARQMTTATDSNYLVYVPGDAHNGLLKLRCARQDRSELLGWWTGTSQGKDDRKSISVSLLNRERRSLRTYNFLECVPVSYSPSGFTSAALASETITIKFARVEFQ